MAIGGIFKKKPAKEAFLSDDGLSEQALSMLNDYRLSIFNLSKAASELKPREVQAKIYEKIVEQEKSAQSIGCVFVVTSEPPYAYCLTVDNYKIYMQSK